MRKAALSVVVTAVFFGWVSPSIAGAQTDFPDQSRFQKVLLNDRPGEPMSLAVLPDGRVLHTARGRRRCGFTIRGMGSTR